MYQKREHDELQVMHSLAVIGGELSSYCVIRLCPYKLQIEVSLQSHSPEINVTQVI